MTPDQVTTGLFDTLEAALLVIGFLAPFLLLYWWSEFKKYRQWQLRSHRFWTWLHSEDE